MTEAGLRRELRLVDALLINVGTILASAIFLVPANILAAVETPFLAALVWLAAGALSWCGAVAMAELSALYPEAGGEYVYLEKVYHPVLGFLYGWSLFSVIQTASIAAVAVALMTYLAYFVPLGPGGIQIGAIAWILGLSAWNCRSLRTSATTQNLTTLAKLGLVGLVVAACLAFGDGSGLSSDRLVPERPAGELASRFGVAMVAALWAYDGWVSVTFVGGEVREPQRFLPRALTGSVVLLVAVYLLLNAGFLAALPAAALAGSERVAADAVEAAIGPLGGAVVSLAVVVSCLAALNGFIFTGARVYYAMAEDRVFFRSFARLNRRRVPAVAILAQGVWASLIALTGTYDQLFTYVIVDSWLFYALAIGGVLVLRRRRPDLPRPYRTPGYPFLPIVFVVVAVALLGNTLWTAPRDSAVGLGILAAGLPLYAYWRRAEGAAVRPASAEGRRRGEGRPARGRAGARTRR